MKLTEFLAKMKRGELLDTATFRHVDCTELLHAREIPSFEGEWLRVYAMLYGQLLTRSDQVVLDELREVSFKQAFAETGDPDLSGYVSDDFDMLGRAICLGIEDPFLALLLYSYRSSKIPGKNISYPQRSFRAELEDMN